jgi:hypothetical protein
MAVAIGNLPLFCVQSLSDFCLVIEPKGAKPLTVKPSIGHYPVPVHILDTYFPCIQVHFNIILLSVLIQVLTFKEVFPEKFYVHFFLPKHATCSVHCNLLDLTTLTILGELCRSLFYIPHSSVLDSDILLRTLFKEPW